MGTICTYKPKWQKLQDFFSEGSSQKTLCSAFVNLSEYYAAVEHTFEDGRKEVFCQVIKVRLFKLNSWGHNISYKEMSEFDNPYYYNCPEKVFKMLSPLCDPAPEYAKQWREIVANKIAAKKSKLNKGAI